MIKIKCIDEFKIGQNIYGFYQSIFKEKKISKNGDYYIDLLLRDKSGQINAKIWQFCEFYETMFNEGDLVAVKGIVKNYRKKLFLEISNISFLDSKRYKKYGFDESDILPSITLSASTIYNNILKDIEKMKSPYKEFLRSIYIKHENEIKLYPDSLSFSNYGKKGSLILKIYNALRIAKSIYRNKSLKDKDIVLSAILLKYLGRIKQYKYNIVFSDSDIGKNENCFILSRDIIKNFSQNNKNLKKSIIMELIDIVLYDNNQKVNENPKGSIVSTIFNLEKSISLNQELEL
jgi:3'-5' exoribonuclease